MAITVGVKALVARRRERRSRRCHWTEANCAVSQRRYGRLRGHPRYPRAAAGRQGRRRPSRASRHARILGRPRQPLPPRGVRTGQDLRAVLRVGLAFRAGQRKRIAADGHGQCLPYRRGLSPPGKAAALAIEPVAAKAP